MRFIYSDGQPLRTGFGFGKNVLSGCPSLELPSLASQLLSAFWAASHKLDHRPTLSKTTGPCWLPGSQLWLQTRLWQHVTACDSMSAVHHQGDAKIAPSPWKSTPKYQGLNSLPISQRPRPALIVPPRPSDSGPLPGRAEWQDPNPGVQSRRWGVLPLFIRAKRSRRSSLMGGSCLAVSCFGHLKNPWALGRIAGLLFSLSKIHDRNYIIAFFL